MKVLFFCSTPNFRGIHQYCLHLFRQTVSISSSLILQPNKAASTERSILRFFYQFFWELFPPFPPFRANVEIYAAPRLPLRRLLPYPNRKRTLCGAVILDFIQYIDDWSPSSLLFLTKRYGLFELIKRIYHSLHFNASLRRLDFLIFISDHASLCFLDKKNNYSKRFSAHSLVLHPSPSFSPDSVNSALESAILQYDPSIFGIHVVTGPAPSKQTNVLELSLSLFKSYVADLPQRIVINVFGYSSPCLQGLSSSNFHINARQSYVDQSLLIQSSLLSDVFLSTSQEEGFGIPLLDSLLFDLHCICTPIEPFQEINRTYASCTNSVNFSSKSDMSSVEEFAKLLLSSLSKRSPVDPSRKASLYLQRCSNIELSSRQSISDFLHLQIQSLVL